MLFQIDDTTMAISDRTGNNSMTDHEYHEPVLFREVVEWLQPSRGKLFVDGTLGGGGHAEAFLKSGARVIALDQDPQALDFAERRLAPWSDSLTAIHANFSEIETVLDRLGVAQIDGALLDLGVSSWQLNSPERGFSFMRNGPLDMRMDPDAPLSAADLVNSASAEELERWFREYGEERAARRIAARIVQDRQSAPFRETFDLVKSVERVVSRRGKTHPATRVFQALRIAVNRELEVLEQALERFSQRLASGARFGVITFHSLEDRIVKQFFKTRATEWLDRPEWPEPRRNPDFIFKPLTGKPVIASESEQKNNPRSRSAKLRVVERNSYASAA